jgi:hypothetical protein
MQKIRACETFPLLEVFCRVHPLGTTKNAVLGWIIRVVLQDKKVQFRGLSTTGIGHKKARTTTTDDPDPKVSGLRIRWYGFADPDPHQYRIKT